MPGLASFENGQKFTIYQMIYVINELVSGKKFTNARSLLSSGLLLPGSTVVFVCLKEYAVLHLSIIKFRVKRVNC